MREFFDTSVLVAAFWGAHVHHDASIKLLASADKKHSACGIHSLAEVYASMSVLPVKPMIPTEQVLLFVEEIKARLTLVSLEDREYSPGNKRVSLLFPATTDGAKRRPLLGNCRDQYISKLPTCCRPV